MRRLTVEVCDTLSISTILWGYRRWIYRERGKEVGMSFTQHLHQLEAKLSLRFTTTPCRFGGRRWWFQCLRCGRRVGKLYQPPAAGEFACRLCYNLTYRACLSEDARAAALHQRLNALHAQGGQQALERAIQALRTTTRGRRLLERIRTVGYRRVPRHEREAREKQGYELYVRPLLEGVRT